MPWPYCLLSMSPPVLIPAQLSFAQLNQPPTPLESASLLRPPATVPRLATLSKLGQALSHPGGGGETQEYLGSAHSIYTAMNSPDWILDGEQGQQGSIAPLEVEYMEMLLGAGGSSVETRAKSTPTDESHDTLSVSDGHGGGGLDAKLMAARRSLCSAQPRAAVDLYKEALRAEPGSVIAWRELATCCELFGSVDASLAALRCAIRVLAKSGDIAPVHLHMAAAQLAAGKAEDALPTISEAFRCGKGGAVGFALRGLINSRTGKASMAARAFESAREADPRVSPIVDALAAPLTGGSTPSVGPSGHNPSGGT